MAEAESEIDPLLDCEPCGFLAFADDGHLRVVNQTLLDMLGYAREELSEAHIETILAVGSRVFYQTHLFPLLRLRGRADEIFLLLRGKSGEDVAVLANAVRRERKGESITDLVLLRLVERRKYEDALLEAKRAAEEATKEAHAQHREVQIANELLERQALELELIQEQLEQQAAELERQRSIAEDANHAKSSFLAMMSHELRTPLNAIGGYVQLLEMGVHGPITEPQAAALGRVTRSQQHLLRLINELLNLARIESGRVDYDLRPISLDDVVRATLPMIEPQLTARGLRYESNVPPQLQAEADPEKLKQILLNLMSNASKFTTAGGRVSVAARVAADNKDIVELAVSDTGLGIPADRLEEIFEPFVQVDDSKAGRADGSGLGLSISREMARGMGGDINVTSTIGAGSSFVIRLRKA